MMMYGSGRVWWCRVACLCSMIVNIAMCNDNHIGGFCSEILPGARTLQSITTN